MLLFESDNLLLLFILCKEGFIIDFYFSFSYKFMVLQVDSRRRRKRKEKNDSLLGRTVFPFCFFSILS